MIEITMKTLKPKKISKGLETNVGKFMQDFLDLVLKYALANLEKNESWVTGNLAQSGKVELKKNLLLMEGEVIFGAPYAAFLEYGTRPHWAPLGPSLKKDQSSTPSITKNPLDYWAWKKGVKTIIPCRMNNKWYGFHTSLGWGVWKKIGAVGSDPHPYLRPAIQLAKTKIKELAKKYNLEFE